MKELQEILSKIIFLIKLSAMKIKELEDKVKQNQKLKETVNNEKELWKNKANNFARSSASNKPELLSQYNKKWTTPTKQEINDMNAIPRKTEAGNKINYPKHPVKDIPSAKKESDYHSNSVTSNFSINKGGKKESENRPRVSMNVNPYPNNNNPYAEKTKDIYIEDNPQGINNNTSIILDEENKPDNHSSGRKSFRSEVSEDENSYEEAEDRLDARKIKNKKFIVYDINSDVENLSQK